MSYDNPQPAHLDRHRYCDGGWSGACCLGTPRRVSTTLSDVTVIYRICYDSIALPPLSTVHPEVHAALMRSPILITLSPAVSTIARLSRLLTYGSANVSFTVTQLPRHVLT